MEQHAIPRQITTFEFKLIGFLTLKQFIYIVLFSGIGVTIFLIFPIPILNVFLAFLTIAAGCALAFIPINERPLDVWIRNFIQKLYEPSQYYFHKKNTAPDFLKDLYFTSPQIVSAHIDARQKLNTYVQNTQAPPVDPRKNSIHSLISDPTQKNSETPLSIPLQPTPVTVTTPEPIISSPPTPIEKPEPLPTPPVDTPIASVAPPEPAEKSMPIPVVTPHSQADKTKPFFFGSIHSAKNIPIPNTLVYIKDSNNKVLRILKSNIHGVFATFHPLTPGEYVLEVKDTSQKYFFDTMKIEINQQNPEPITVHSKEIV
jgi:hypothetical protein